jgi:hypothetical protein
MKRCARSSSAHIHRRRHRGHRMATFRGRLHGDGQLNVAVLNRLAPVTDKPSDAHFSEAHQRHCCRRRMVAPAMHSRLLKQRWLPRTRRPATSAPLAELNGSSAGLNASSPLSEPRAFLRPTPLRSHSRSDFSSLQQ